MDYRCEKVNQCVGEPAPSVSVIIPAYNVAPYIAETLESVFSQTFKDFEVVIVNDGSPDTDDLERALAPYRERIHYLRQENRGASGARNRAVREARGEFVAFLDGDDLWMPNYLEKQVGFLRAGGYDLSYADALLFGDSPLAGKTFMATAPSHGPVTFISLIRYECNIITSGVVARRAKIVEAGLFHESLRNAQDFEMWTRLLRFGGRIGYQREVLLRYRCRQNSLSGDVMNRLATEMHVLKHIADTYELMPAEREELSRAMELQEASLHLAQGKHGLLRGRFDEAHTSFKRAHAVFGGWKLRLAVVMLRVAPRLLRKLAHRRLSTEC
jgi:glycosyltransferase involved in cell wall biosynthesis